MKYLTGKETKPLNIVQVIFKDYFQKDKVVLDLGCGAGRHLKFMPEGSYGVDIDTPKNLKTSYRLIELDLNQFPYDFDTEFCDVILCSHILEHLESPYLVLNEIKKLLKSDGVLIIGVPNPNCFYFNFYELSDKQYWSEHLYEWNQKQFIRFLNNSGFEVEKTLSNFPFPSKRLGLIWNKLPILKSISSDIWLVCRKSKLNIKNPRSKRYRIYKLIKKLMTKL